MEGPLNIDCALWIIVWVSLFLKVLPPVLIIMY